jgi:hypothetical protein
MYLPSPIKVLDITLPLRFLEYEMKVVLNFRDLLKVIGYLKPLHIWHSQVLV